LQERNVGIYAQLILLDIRSVMIKINTRKVDKLKKKNSNVYMRFIKSERALFDGSEPACGSDS